MVVIPKRSGKFTITGVLRKVNEFQAFKSGKRGRVGVQLEVKGKTWWFNCYGTEESLRKQWSSVEYDDTLTVHYNSREYTDGEGNAQKSRDIVSFEKVPDTVQKGVKQSVEENLSLEEQQDEASAVYEDSLEQVKTEDWMFNVVNAINDIQKCCKEALHVLDLHAKELKKHGV